MTLDLVTLYMQRDSGLWGALMIFTGLIGATIAGLIIDYTKKYKEVAVVSVGLALLCFIWFMEVRVCLCVSVLNYATLVVSC